MKKLIDFRLKTIGLLSVFVLSAVILSCSQDKKTKKVKPEHVEVVSEMKADLTAPPFVPSPTGHRPPTKLIVDMEIIEHVAEIAPGVDYTFWTFGGSVPGRFIRAKLGDEIEFHLKNHPDNQLPHNIDLHAVNGPGGGAVSSFVAPGREIVFSFKTLHPGLYVYHCATAPVGMHIGNGMYGLILIEPEEGLPQVDKEYYVMQGDFYTTGEYGEPGSHVFDMQKAMNETPDYVLFNGKVGALTGENSLKAEVGETVRLYVGNGGPNLVSSFHVIGEIMDRVHVGGASLINENVQTTLIPAGGAAIVEFKVDAPGEYIIVDHSIMRAFNKGALAALDVTGYDDKKVYTGTIMEGVYLPEGSRIQLQPSNKDAVEALEDADKEEMSKEEKIKFGEKLYAQTCFACHQPTGKGMAGAFPPLAESDYLNADVERAIDIVIHGLRGEITVNGEAYNSIMPAQQLNDEEAAAVLTYIYNSWGNNGTEVSSSDVKAKR